MPDFDYVEMRKKGLEYFATIDHNTQLTQMLCSDYPEIKAFPFLSVEEQRAKQLTRLSKIVDYAFENIPLYRRKYDSVGYRPGDIKSFDDFEQLPILYKDELIEAFPFGMVKKLDDLQLSTRSSGSSGRFVTLGVDLHAIYVDTLQGIRQFEWQSDFTYQSNHVVLFIYTCPWWINNINGQYKQDFLNTNIDPEIALRHILNTRPYIISTYPTYLQRLCGFGIKLSDYGVHYVIVHSEQSTKEMRSEMSKILGVVVRDEFSSEELTRIALECKYGHYHIEEDACYVEVVNPDTKDTILNGTGMLIGTNLLNVATPIIRYHQGDIVTIDGNSVCACGHHGRLITQIEGREMDCIHTHDKVIPASAFMDIAYNWFLTKNIPIHGMKYQFVQTDTTHIVVYIKKGAYIFSDSDISSMKESVLDLVGHDMCVEIEYTNRFIQNSRKYKPVVCLVSR